VICHWHAANTGLTFRSYAPHNAWLILRKCCGAAMVAIVATFLAIAIYLFR